MKRSTRIVLALLLWSAIVVLAGDSFGEVHAAARLSAAARQSTAVALSQQEQDSGHCTVFYAADDRVALGGNNEDALNPRTAIWFLPPEEGKYGLAVVGYEDFVWQGAVNDHGLFYDALAVRDVEVPAESGKPIYPGNLVVKAMTECSSVDCVLQLYDEYSRGPGNWNGQLFFGDSTGDSAIIEPLAVIRKAGQYQVATNYFQSEVAQENRTDDRYVKATSMLEKADLFSVDLFRDILNATHQEGTVHTLYSTIYDLKQGRIDLYFFHDFEHKIELDLKGELAKGVHSYDIASLFPASPAAITFGKPIADQVVARQGELGHAQPSADLLATYAGNYEFAPEQVLAIKSEGKRLFARDVTIPWIELAPVSDTRFARVIADGMGQVREVTADFQCEGGRVTGLEFDDGAGHTLLAAKQAPPAPTARADQPAAVQEEAQPTSPPDGKLPASSPNSQSSDRISRGWSVIVGIVLVAVLLSVAFLWRRRSLTR